MIETLNGMFETVNFKQDTSMKLYDNDKHEDYPTHWHTALEIIMPTENIYTVESQDQTIVLREGDIIFLCPGCIHTLYSPPKGRRIIFQPDTTALRYMKEMQAILTMMAPLCVITPEDFPELHKEVHDTLLEIRDVYASDEPFSEIIICSKLLKIMALIGKDYTYSTDSEALPSNYKQEEYMGKFIQICDYITEHCTEELTLDAVADISGFSKFYFSRLFKQFTHVSFYKYVNQKRIALAEQLLTEPGNSITDIALNSGFSSISSFIRMFKIVKGCTPTQYRHMYRSFH